jgi:glycosyltransferase involved in cell wall biosynthesis
MNALQICPNPFPSLGGPAKTYRQFHEAVGVRSLGFVAPSDGINQNPVVPLADVVRTLGGRGIRKYYYAPPARLRKAEKEIGSADLVFIHGLFTHPGVWAAKTCRRLGVPYAIALHGILDPWALRRTRIAKQLWLRVFGSAMLEKSAAVICATHREAQKAAPYLAGSVMTSVIGWACDETEGLPVGRDRIALRRELGFSESDRVLVFLGRLHSMKRPVETVRAMSRLGDSRLKLLVVGPDDDVTTADLEAEARALGWDGLRVVGPVFGAEKFGYLCAGDGFISLSHRENFNFSLVEAMAAGLPPILSPGNDLGWEFAGEGFSWQLRTEDMAEAGAAIQEFANLPGEGLRRRGEAAAKWAEENLEMDRLRSNLEILFETVAGRRRTQRA